LPLPVDAGLGDRLNMAYSSTLVRTGQGRGVAVATGADTEIGEIHRLVGEAADLSTPLTRKLATFSKWLTVAILALAAFSFGLGLLRGEPVDEMLNAAVALAVGAIPEGLPAAVTITLAIGMARMARRHAIVRKLPATETLGSTTVICSDKTGTLTQNRMTVRTVADPSGLQVDPGPDLGCRAATRACLEVGVLCNDARLTGPDGGDGDPTELALLVSAETAGLRVAEVRARLPRVETLPFDPERRFMATVHRLDDGHGLVAVKGGVERVLSLCGSQLDVQGRSEPLDRAAALATAEELAGQGLRVLAFARVRRAGSPVEQLLDEPALVDLTFLGLQAMADPPRPEAVRAVARCRSAGIAVKMITGDHSATARAIAAQVGLDDARDDCAPVVTGSDLHEVPEDELADLVERTRVFARVSAEQKLRIVEGLQRRHHVVAMTGDGVNDAPALKQADIGIAMGRTGTDVAKESADMVLTDDNFATIEAAVEEGRGVFDNLTKFITWTLPTNLAEGLVILAAIVLATELPILPVQILWINMTTAVALGLMLAFEPAEPGLMDRPPRDPHQPILTGHLVGRIVVVSTVVLVGAFGLFEWQQAVGGSLEQARTLAVNAFVGAEIAYLFNCRSLERPVRQLGWLSNRPLVYGVLIMVALQLAFTYLPAMNAVFQTAPMTADGWAAVLALALSASGVVGLEKWWRRRRAGGTGA
jgi:cation-transporting ATPase F